MKSSGKSGTVALKVKGDDTKGGSQSTTVTYRSTRSGRARPRRGRADRTGPHRTAPDGPVLLRTGTIVP